jgi:hypothetical protein
VPFWGGGFVRIVGEAGQSFSGLTSKVAAAAPEILQPQVKRGESVSQIGVETQNPHG